MPHRLQMAVQRVQPPVMLQGKVQGSPVSAPAAFLRLGSFRFLTVSTVRESFLNFFFLVRSPFASLCCGSGTACPGRFDAPIVS